MAVYVYRTTVVPLACPMHAHINSPQVLVGLVAAECGIRQLTRQAKAGIMQLTEVEVT